MTVKKLPTVVIAGKKYFIDKRLKQLRNVENPHDFINDYITISCCTCKRLLFIGRKKDAKRLIICCENCAKVK